MPDGYYTNQWIHRNNCLNHRHQESDLLPCFLFAAIRIGSSLRKSRLTFDLTMFRDRSFRYDVSAKSLTKMRRVALPAGNNHRFLSCDNDVPRPKNRNQKLKSSQNGNKIINTRKLFYLSLVCMQEQSHIDVVDTFYSSSISLESVEQQKPPIHLSTYQSRRSQCRL